MFLGIEIGGTKLQLGVGDGRQPEFVGFERAAIDPSRGAAGILDQIERLGLALCQRLPIERVGIGFGGPVDSARGRCRKSHQIAGWDDFPICDWIERALGKPVALGNDCDVAAIAEATFGAGQGAGSVFYVTVGTGVGGGFVVDGKLHGRSRPAVAEIGHLRPGVHEDRADATVESLCSGWGIVAAARAQITGGVSRSLDVLRRVGVPLSVANVRQRLDIWRKTADEYAADLLQRCGADADALTGQHVAEAAREGNEMARDIIDHATLVLGWAIAQTVTLLAPEVVVIGGGVSLMGDDLFFDPVRRAVERYVFPPLKGSYRIEPAALGELAVVHGAVVQASGENPPSCR